MIHFLKILYVFNATLFFSITCKNCGSNANTYWDTSTSSQVSNCDDVVFEIYLDEKFQ